MSKDKMLKRISGLKMDEVLKILEKLFNAALNNFSSHNLIFSQEDGIGVTFRTHGHIDL
jgi:hypothetical protein